MTTTSYREYAMDLRERMQKLRSSDNVRGTMEVVIFRNAFCYRSFEVVGKAYRRDYHSGSINTESKLVREDGQDTCREIDSFFLLPEVYAYSDRALQADRNPLKHSHWDGTLALIEVKYSTAVTTWHQRMLFIGFCDPIHADFAMALDKDIFKDGSSGGTRLFEWRPVGIPQINRSADAQPAQPKCPASGFSAQALPPGCRECLSSSGGSRSQAKCAGRFAVDVGAGVMDLPLSS